MPRKKKLLFGLTEGESNKVVDAIFHRRAKKDVRYWALDFCFHAIVEQDPRVSAEKFIKYSLPKIVDQLAKEYHRRQRKPF